MPITSSAIKTLRKDIRRTLANQIFKKKVKTAVKKSRVHPSKKNYQSAASLLDRAAKKKVFHRNKANRIKSRLAKRLASLQNK